MQNNRVVHITLQKCASQWVRDLLNAPEILPYSHHPYSGITSRTNDLNELKIPTQTFSGPIYGMTSQDWQAWKGANDQAIVVLRDPRDRLISMLFSRLYSHGPDNFIDVERMLMHQLSNLSEQMKYMMLQLSHGESVKMYTSWTNHSIPSALVITYEALVKDQTSLLKKIMQWLNWNVPDEVLQAVIHRLSFETRSGRKPGQENKFSHLRRGVANDWKNYFNRAHGELWEKLFPGFLRKIGYEQHDDWWKILDEQLPAHAQDISSENKRDELIYALETKLKQYQTALEEKESVIQALIQTQNDIEKNRQINMLTKTCEERLALIQDLHAHGHAYRIEIEKLQAELAEKK